MHEHLINRLTALSTVTSLRFLLRFYMITGALDTISDLRCNELLAGENFPSYNTN